MGSWPISGTIPAFACTNPRCHDRRQTA